LTVIKVPQGIDSNKIVKHAYSRYNLSIGIGLSQVTRAAAYCSWWHETCPFFAELCTEEHRLGQTCLLIDV
jgi:hypothetical protein